MNHIFYNFLNQAIKNNHLKFRLTFILNLVLQVLEKVLTELEKVCIAEQDFCFKFFHLIDKTSATEEDADVWKAKQTYSSSELVLFLSYSHFSLIKMIVHKKIKTSVYYIYIVLNSLYSISGIV